VQSHQGVKQHQRIVERRVERTQPCLDLGTPRGLVVGVFDAEVTIELTRRANRRAARDDSPIGGVRRGLGGLVVAQVEEGDTGAVGHAKEDMRVRAEFLGARYPILADDVDQRQAEDVLLEVPGLLRVAASVGEMTQSVDRNEGRHTVTSLRVSRDFSFESRFSPAA
jgi:hypothetical protein